MFYKFEQPPVHFFDNTMLNHRSSYGWRAAIPFSINDIN